VAAKIPFRLLQRSGTLSLRTGYAVGDSVPQLEFRAGGPFTVRGYDYGYQRAAGGWSAQLDWALRRRGWVWTPVVFADVGSVYHGGPFDPLVGVGGGVSFFGGFARLNAAWGVNPETGFRFDLLFRAPR
jgi:hemolysin activation/secretion protein